MKYFIIIIKILMCLSNDIYQNICTYNISFYTKIWGHIDYWSRKACTTMAKHKKKMSNMRVNRGL